MGAWKSPVDVDLYVDLLLNVLADAYQSYPEIPSREAARDELTIRRRVGFEGLSFLTKTLPKLGRALVEGLESGQLTVPPEFAAKHKAGEQWNIPNLFSALFLTIFDSQGTLVHETGTAVGFLRQLTLLCYKLECPLTSAQAEAAELKYKTIESELPSESQIRQNVDPVLIRRARFLLGRLFAGFHPGEIAPRHGPGAVADRNVRGRKKYDISYYSPAIDRLYPYVSFCTFGIHTQNPADLTGHLDLKGVQPPSKVVFVPKDSRGPRVISCEPALLQYLQQGIARETYRLVESHYLTRDSVRFTDQQPNRSRALSSSIDGRYSTIDLADASDRVSLDLVKMLFPEHILPYLLATRSELTQLPSGEVLPLKKFAPMGSALCFPVEALTFWAIAVASTWMTSRRLGLVRPDIYVYGDDIIVKTRDVERVTSALECFGLKVNRGKCFSRGKFRESCGCDAFNGEDVTPVKLRALRVRDRKSSLVDVYRMSESAKHLFDRGYWKSAEFLWSWCEKLVGELPTTDPRFQGISRTSTVLPPLAYTPHGLRTRWNKDLQKIEVKSIRLKSRREHSPFSKGVYRLGHNLIGGMPEPYDDNVAVPHSAQAKAVWLSPC